MGEGEARKKPTKPGRKKFEKIKKIMEKVKVIITVTKKTGERGGNGINGDAGKQLSVAASPGSAPSPDPIDAPWSRARDGLEGRRRSGYRKV